MSIGKKPIKVERKNIEKSRKITSCMSYKKQNKQTKELIRKTRVGEKRRMRGYFRVCLTLLISFLASSLYGFENSAECAPGILLASMMYNDTRALEERKVERVNT